MDIDSVLKGHGIGIGGSNIKSIQRGTANLANLTNLNITISPININKSIVRIKFNSGDSYIDKNQAAIKIIDSVTINVSRTTASPNLSTVSWEVIEYNNVKSLQSGTCTIVQPDNAISVPISNININKSLIFTSYKHTSTDTASGYLSIIDEFVDSTTIKFTRFAGAYNHIVNWQVIEFN